MKTSVWLSLCFVLALVCWVAGAGEPGADRAGQSGAEGKTAVAASDRGLERVQEGLARRAWVSFSESKLTEVADVLTSTYRVPVRIDRRALADAGVAADAPVNLPAAEVTLEDGLDRIVRPLGLGWTIRDGVVSITTPEAVDETMITKVYAVGDLLPERPPMGPEGDGLEDLAAVLRATEERDSWMASGGRGSISPISAGGVRALVVRQSWPAHRRIGALLDGLRQIGKPPRAAGPRRRAPKWEDLVRRATHPYAWRTMPDRAGWIERLGGTRESEAAVEAGLAFLARNQAPDGSWSCGFARAFEGERPQDIRKPHGGTDYRVAFTGLAVLAFQGAGHDAFGNGRYTLVVRRGLDWLLTQQTPDGAVLDAKRTEHGRRSYDQYMYEHGIATWALADACAAAIASGTPPDERYLRAATAAVRFIESQQHDDGGWRYTADRSRVGDTSVTGWQMMALHSARQAGIPVGRECIDRMRKYFHSAARQEDGRTLYTRSIGVVTDATTAAGLLARLWLLDEPDAPLVPKAADFLAENCEARLAEMKRGDKYATDFYLWHHGTLALHEYGGQPWRRWNAAVRDILVARQCREGWDSGSWDAESHWGNSGGRLYTTAMAVLTLETYYRFMPQRRAAGMSHPCQKPD